MMHHFQMMIKVRHFLCRFCSVKMCFTITRFVSVYTEYIYIFECLFSSYAVLTSQEWISHDVRTYVDSFDVTLVIRHIEERKSGNIIFFVSLHHPSSTVDQLVGSWKNENILFFSRFRFVWFLRLLLQFSLEKKKINNFFSILSCHLRTLSLKIIFDPIDKKRMENIFIMNLTA